MRFRDKIRGGVSLIKSGVARRRFPLSVLFHNTIKCNLKCSYCSAWKRTVPEMTTEQIKSMLDQLAEMGTRKFSYAGGESLLRDDAGEIISYAGQKGMFTTLTTNSLLVPERIDQLRDLDLWIVSLDGPNSKHERTKHVPVEDVLAMIDLLVSRNRKVWTNTTLTAGPRADIDFVISQAREHGFRANFQLMRTYPLALNIDESLLCSREEIIEAFSYLIWLKIKGAPIINSFSYLNRVKEHPFGMFDKCLAGKNYCLIDANGDVYPCDDFQDRLNVENGLEVGFKRAFELMPEFDCQGCTFPCYIENNFLFALNPETVWNAIKEVW